MKEGLWLTNTDYWGIHDKGTPLVYLSSIQNALDDTIISVAKDFAKEMKIDNFAIVHVDADGKKLMLYYSNRG